MIRYKGNKACVSICFWRKHTGRQVYRQNEL